MKSFIKILSYLFALFFTNIGEAKNIVLDVDVLEIISTDNEVNIKNELSVISENDISIACKSDRNLVAYRNLVKDCEASAAKTGTAPKGWIALQHKWQAFIKHLLLLCQR